MVAGQRMTVHSNDHMILAGDYRIHARYINYIRVDAVRDRLHIYLNCGENIKLTDLHDEIIPFFSQYKYWLKSNNIPGHDLLQPVPE